MFSLFLSFFPPFTLPPMIYYIITEKKVGGDPSITSIFHISSLPRYMGEKRTELRPLGRCRKGNRESGKERGAS